MSINNVSDKQKHSGAHVVAMAASRLYKNVKVGIGPVTKEGFYYDLDVSHILKQEDLNKIEIEANNIVQENLKFQQLVLPREEAINLLLQKGQIFKAELINSISDSEISFYKTGDEFIDLCRGPHVISTNQIGLIKITKIENSFWNEDTSRPKLQRIYGKIFANFNELQEYLQLQKDLKEKNYVSLSQKYNLAINIKNRTNFTYRGTAMYKRILEKIDSSINLKISSDFSINEYLTNEIELEEILNTLIPFNSLSYRDYKQTFTYNATLSSLSFKKTLENIKVKGYRNYFFTNEITSDFGIKIDKFSQIFKELQIDVFADLISSEFEDLTTSIISNTFQKNFISHNKFIDSSVKDIVIHFKIKDKFEKEWIFAYCRIQKLYAHNNQLISLLEFNILPLEIWKYIVEKFEGIIPIQLAPEQISIVPVNKRFYDYGYKIRENLIDNGFSCIVNDRSKSFKSKIKKVETNNSPIILIVGEKEFKNNGVSIRQNHTDLGLINLEDLIKNPQRYISKV